MHQKFKEYKIHLTDKYFRKSYIISIVFLIIATIINFYAGMYATESASSSVTDIILSNTRAYDLDAVFVYGTFILIIYIFYVCLRKPNQSPFVVKSISLFIVIRSIFISLTHIGPFPSQIIIHSDILRRCAQDDGHPGS